MPGLRLGYVSNRQEQFRGQLSLLFPRSPLLGLRPRYRSPKDRQRTLGQIPPGSVPQPRLTPRSPYRRPDYQLAQEKASTDQPGHPDWDWSPHSALPAPDTCQASPAGRGPHPSKKIAHSPQPNLQPAKSCNFSTYFATNYRSLLLQKNKICPRIRL